MIRILYPTDLSRNSGQKLSYLIEMSRHLAVKLTLLHVYRENYSPRRPFIEEGSLKSQTKAKLYEFSKEYLAGHSLVDLKLIAEEGAIVPVINTLSSKWTFDLIVMPLDLRFRWIGRLFGTRTTELANAASCPVLVIRKGQRFAKNPKLINAYLYKGNNNRRKSISSLLKRLFNSPHNNAVEKHLEMDVDEDISFGKFRSKILKHLDNGQKNLLVLHRKKLSLFSNWIHDILTRLILFDIKSPVLIVGKNVVHFNPMNDKDMTDLQ